MVVRAIVVEFFGIWDHSYKRERRRQNEKVIAATSVRGSFCPIQFRGLRKSGHWKTGHRKTGHRKIGHWKTGHQKTGHRKTGHRENWAPRKLGTGKLGTRKIRHRENWAPGKLGTGKTRHRENWAPEKIHEKKCIFGLGCERKLWILIILLLST